MKADRHSVLASDRPELSDRIAGTTGHGEAEAAIDACFDGAFGAAGAELVIEEG